MKAFSDRNRDQHPPKGGLEGVEATSVRGCAQKELNLQPAGYYRRGDELVIVFPPAKPVAEQDENPPTEPEASSGNRNGSVTEPGHLSGSNHKPFALENRPDLLAGLEAFALAAMLAPTRSARGWP